MNNERYIDYFLATLFVVESLFLAYVFIYKISWVIYILPCAVASAAFVFAFLAVRDFIK